MGGLDPESFTQKPPPPSTCSPSTSGGQTRGRTATARSCTKAEPRSSALSGWSRCGRRSSQSFQSVPPRSCPSGSESDQARRPAIRRLPRVRRRLAEEAAEEEYEEEEEDYEEEEEE